MDIKSYDEGVYSYSGTDEEYAEFLENVDGKLNEGEPVEDNDLGDTKKINLQDVLSKFRKTAGGIKDVSKKITAEAVNKFEDFKKGRGASSYDEYDISDEYDEETAPSESVVCADLEELGDSLKINSDKADDILTKAEKISEQLNGIDINCRDISRNIEENKLKTADVYEGVEEIRKAVSGINKLNDSIFDLKNAQLNAKNSLEELEKSFTGLKKKCIWGVMIISVLTLISIVLEIIILLS